ncbi:MAG: hypothetical protein R3E83_09785 [Burkholderiaceae bacterium]
MAVLCAALAYGIMNLLMVATPLAVQVCSLPFDDAAFVLGGTSSECSCRLVHRRPDPARFGVLRIVFTGGLLMLVCVGIALSGSHIDAASRRPCSCSAWAGTSCTGGSTLLTQSYRPQEKNRVQGFMDSVVFATMISTSASSGVLLFVNGWGIINLVSLPFVLICVFASAWLASRHGWRFGAAAPAR